MARIEVLHEEADDAALAGRVPPLDDNDDAIAVLLHRALQLHQLDLQRRDLLEEGLLFEPLVVGKAAGG